MENNHTRVLVAEDSQTERTLIADLLREHDLHVDQAADGRTALDLCRIVRPQLVVLDIGLPSLDGWEVLARIRADRKLSNTPVLILTADERDSTAARALEDGDATDFLSKPVRPLELVARVGRTLRDAAARRQLIEQNRILSQAAAIDALTGLPNRRASAQALTQAAAAAHATGQPFAVALIDIDHFKKVNDHYGHSTGDRVLCAIAGRLHDHTRTNDVIGRWGGEEFIAVLPATDPDHAQTTAHTLLRAAGDQPVNVGEHTITVTVSVGWASGDEHPPELLVELADTALYAAKNSGRNCVRAAHPPQAGHDPAHSASRR